MDLRQLRMKRGKYSIKKFKLVFDKNSRYKILKLHKNENDIDLIDPAIIRCYKQFLITNIDVEHVFSRLTFYRKKLRNVHNYKF